MQGTFRKKTHIIIYTVKARTVCLQEMQNHYCNNKGMCYNLVKQDATDMSTSVINMQSFIQHTTHCNKLCHTVDSLKEL